MTKITGKQPKVYQLAMENFESELDSLLDQLLTPSNQEKKTTITMSSKGHSAPNETEFVA